MKCTLYSYVFKKFCRHFLSFVLTYHTLFPFLLLSFCLSSSVLPFFQINFFVSLICLFFKMIYSISLYLITSFFLFTWARCIHCWGEGPGSHPSCPPSPPWSGSDLKFASAIRILSCHAMPFNRRRRKSTEEKAKVIAAVWGVYLNAALTI